MKEYIKSRILMIIETLIVMTILLFINKSSITNITHAVAQNDTNIKTLDKQIINDAQDELYKEGLYNPLYTFTGDLTGYVGNCPLCTGYLACPPRTNVLKEGIYHDDKTYGKVRIVASSKNYPCGTIIRFNTNRVSDEPVIAIILDRGVGGNDIDLLTDSEDDAIKNIGRVKLEFEVLRNGWNNE